MSTRSWSTGIIFKPLIQTARSHWHVSIWHQEPNQRLDSKHLYRNHGECSMSDHKDVQRSADNSGRDHSTIPQNFRSFNALCLVDQAKIWQSCMPYSTTPTRCVYAYWETPTHASRVKIRSSKFQATLKIHASGQTRTVNHSAHDPIDP